jgi:hypothetical protein
MTTNKLHIWVEEPVSDADGTTFSAVIEDPVNGRQTLWYKLPSQSAKLACNSFDAFIVANIFLIMKAGADCNFHGTLSPSLLRNLVEFQSAWAAWRPERYKQVEISADKEEEEIVAEPRAVALAAFSGGVDSTFTIFRHTIGACPEAWRRDIKACLFVNGFDIPLDNPDAFDRACKKIENTLSTVDVKLITMSTNLQALNIEWDDTHIAGLASSLMFFKSSFNEGLIASGCAYSGLVIPWGSNPITDHLLSSSSFRFIHDGASVKRLEKIKLLSAWPDGYDNLRVCFSAEKRDENCGLCAKCVMDILLMRLEGVRQPASYPQLTDAKLADLEIPTPHQFAGFESVVAKAREAGIKEAWVSVLDKRIGQLRRAISKCNGPIDRLEKFFSRVTRF